MNLTSSTQSEFKLRIMRNSDLDLVVQNELTSYEYGWNKRIFVDCLRAGYQCWVLASRDKIIGHGVLSVAVGESHLLTLCVSPNYQRRGLGKTILRFLLERAAKEDADVCFLEVRPSNSKARSLYLSMGFVPIAVRKNYYPAGADREDAIIMSRNLSA